MMLCPNCAAQVPPLVWKLVAAFVTTPLLVAAVVLAVVVRAHRKS
jgi:hypothetical protein